VNVPRSTWLRWAAVAAVGLVVVAVMVALPLGYWAGAFVDWVREAGPAGVVVYAIVYVAATILLLPGALLTAGAGLVYGPIWGTVLVSPVSVAAATCAFLLGRTVARDRIARRIETDEKFRAIDAAIGRSGLRLVILLRLSTVVPFNLLNYALGLTTVRVRDYVIGSFVGMLPATILYVYVGSLVSNVSALSTGVQTGGPAGQVVYWVGLAATVAAAVVITRVAKRAISAELSRTGSERLGEQTQGTR
jgi:uncharacterized membrane protein YdjX (TVP38/TMEM64 family)